MENPWLQRPFFENSWSSVIEFHWEGDKFQQPTGTFIMVVPISSTASRQPHALNRTHHSDIGLQAAEVTFFGPKVGLKTAWILAILCLSAWSNGHIRMLCFSGSFQPGFEKGVAKIRPKHRVALISNLTVFCCSNLSTHQLPKDTIPESNTTPTSKSRISWQPCMEISLCGSIMGCFLATRQPHALNRTANISDTGLAAEEIAVPLRCSGTTSREGLPIRNQSYGTWKGLRQILIHYETAQPRKAELLFSGMLSGPSQCWALERFPRLRNTFASQRH